jgi:hypothetical protein
VIAWIDAAMAVDAQPFAVDQVNRTGYEDRRNDPNSSGAGLLGVRYVWNGRKHPKSEGGVVEIVPSPFGNLAGLRPQTGCPDPLTLRPGQLARKLDGFPLPLG